MKSLKKTEERIEAELRKLEEVEYGLKELIHGIIIGIIIGFALAWFLLR